MDLSGTDDVMQGVARALRAGRRRYRLSQRELATVLGVDRALVGRWECGEGPRGVADVERVLAVLGFRLVVVPRDDDEWHEVDAQPDHLADRALRRFPAHLVPLWLAPEQRPLEWWLRYRDRENPNAPGWTYRMEPGRRAEVRRRLGPGATRDE